MKRKVLSIDSASDAYEAGKVMLDEQGGYVLVENNHTVVGIITWRDFVEGIMKWRAAPSEINVRHIMSSPVQMIEPERTLEEALTLMSKKGIRRLPVLNDEKIIGIVFSSDLARLLANDEIQQISDEVIKIS